MVQIFVKASPDSPGSMPEYTIIELQGDLESKQGAKFDGNFVGDLHFTKEGVPVFIIGHHILYGKSVKLEKPLAVMVKLDAAVVQSMEGQDTACSSEDAAVKEYHIKAIVRKKFLFKTRPKPIIVNVPKKS